MKALKIGNLNIPVPIIQGGMGVCVSLSGLASAVANEGGIGVISAVGIGMTEPNYRKDFRNSNMIALRKHIQKARSLSNGIIGVNIMLAASDFENLLRVTLEEGADAIFLSAGLPLKVPTFIENFKECPAKFIPKVSSARAAKFVFKFWDEKYNRVPDAIVVEGPLSGGHQGFSKDDLHDIKITLADIVKDTIEEMRFFEEKYGIEIPVIAAGGIYTGKDIAEIMAVGAKGVKMGSRFVTTTECDVTDAFKQSYLNCTDQDMTIIDSPVGLPARVINNSFIKEVQNGEQKPIKCSWKCLVTCEPKKVKFCIAEALFSAAQGDMDRGFCFGGTNTYKAERIMTVKETFEELKEGYYQAQEVGAELVEAC